MDTFRAYCYDGDGRYRAPITLHGVVAVVDFMLAHKDEYNEVRIVDSDDYIVAQAINGEVTFPPKEV